MERKAYLEQEKGEMKKRLQSWGQTMARLAWKGDELQKRRAFYEMQKKIWQGDTSERGQEAMEQIEAGYDREAQRLKEEMDAILAEKESMDSILRGLEPEEATYVRLRFEKGHGFDYIGMKMFLSRATLFRMQNRILQKLVLRERELGTQ